MTGTSLQSQFSAGCTFCHFPDCYHYYYGYYYHYYSILLWSSAFISVTTVASVCSRAHCVYKLDPGPKPRTVKPLLSGTLVYFVLGLLGGFGVEEILGFRVLGFRALRCQGFRF